MSDENKVVYISDVLAERDELAICRLWDEFRDAADELYTYRDYESLVQVLLAIERVKRFIVKVMDAD